MSEAAVRICAVCGFTRLRNSNPGEVCGPCEDAAAERERNIRRLRYELEEERRGMGGCPVTTRAGWPCTRPPTANGYCQWHQHLRTPSDEGSSMGMNTATSVPQYAREVVEMLERAGYQRQGRTGNEKLWLRHPRMPGTRYNSIQVSSTPTSRSGARRSIVAAALAQFRHHQLPIPAELYRWLHGHDPKPVTPPAPVAPAQEEAMGTSQAEKRAKHEALLGALRKRGYARAVEIARDAGVAASYVNHALRADINAGTVVLWKEARKQGFTLYAMEGVTVPNAGRMTGRPQPAEPTPAVEPVAEPAVVEPTEPDAAGADAVAEQMRGLQEQPDPAQQWVDEHAAQQPAEPEPAPEPEAEPEPEIDVPVIDRRTGEALPMPSGNGGHESIELSPDALRELRRALGTDAEVNARLTLTEEALQAHRALLVEALQSLDAMTELLREGQAVAP